MTRTIWDWLGIEQTCDKALIRKAYASQSKKYHPEDMPEEARQLREAYKQALALAERDRETRPFHDHKEHGEKPERTGDEEKLVQILLKHGDAVYRYDQETQQEERIISLENINRKYQYDQESKKETQTVSPKSAEKHYQYHIDAKGEEYRSLRGTGHFDHFRFDRDRTGRLELLEERLTGFCQGGGQRDSNLWSGEVKKCLTAEDLKDAHVISAVLSILIQMHRLSYSTWDALEQVLFCCRGDGAEWTWLQNQFAIMRKEDIGFHELREPVKQKRMTNLQVDPVTGQMVLKEPPQVEYNEMWETICFLLGVAIFFFILFLIARI